jgi:hypothetical protein
MKAAKGQLKLILLMFTEGLYFKNSECSNQGSEACKKCWTCNFAPGIHRVVPTCYTGTDPAAYSGTISGSYPR